MYLDYSTAARKSRNEISAADQEGRAAARVYPYGMLRAWLTPPYIGIPYPLPQQPGLLV